MGLFFLVLVSSLIASASISSAEISPKVGVCYGQLGNNLPKPSKSVDLLKKLNAKQVKIYDANPKILKALKGTDLRVSIMVPNEIINNISSNQALADQWVKMNVVPFYPLTKIRYLLVGNEITSNPQNSTWFNLVPAMYKIRYSLKKFGLKKIKVGTPFAMDILETSFPPSNGTFRSDLTHKVVSPLLNFVNRTKSFFFVDVYPYFAWASQPNNINLDYALMSPTNFTYTDPVSGLLYTNLLDQMLDSLVFAMKRLGYPDIRLFIAETGWPNGGDITQIGSNIYNSATYNRNVVRKFMSKPVIGIPTRPFSVIPTFLFALYNENQKPGPGTERHFGLLYPNGTGVYGIDLSGRTPDSYYKPLPKPTNNKPYPGKLWCVVAQGANRTALADALSYACGQGHGTCNAIQPGGICSKPNNLIRHSSYAFSSYWAQFVKVGGSCSFNGLAVATAKDPSYGYCKYPSTML